MPTQNQTHTWPELAAGLYDKLTERDAEIAYSFDNFELGVPSSTDVEARHANWRVNGSLTITTRNRAND